MASKESKNRSPSPSVSRWRPVICDCIRAFNDEVKNQLKEGGTGEVFIEKQVPFLGHDTYLSIGWLSTSSAIFELRERKSCSRLGNFELWKIMHIA